MALACTPAVGSVTPRMARRRHPWRPAIRPAGDFGIRLPSGQPGMAGEFSEVFNDIIEQHGGEIVVDSELGKATTFTVRLPVIREVAELLEA